MLAMIFAYFSARDRDQQSEIKLKQTSRLSTFVLVRASAQPSPVPHPWYEGMIAAVLDGVAAPYDDLALARRSG